MEARQPISQTADSVIYRFQWTQTIPVADNVSFGTPSREIEALFLDGAEQEVDTTWSNWDPINGILVRTASNQYTGCRWKDSSNFDAHNRLIFQEECLGTIDACIYRAWFENPTDSLPRRSSLRDPSLGVGWLDTIYASPNPNRPDTLNGNSSVVLVRDGSGRVVLARSLGSTPDSTIYRYDAQGRLIPKISVGSNNAQDTLLYLYSWNDATGIRRTAYSATHGARLVRDGLELDLPAPDRVRVDILTLDGKRHPVVADRNLNAGRILVPLSARVGELVRVRWSQGESILRVPPGFE